MPVTDNSHWFLVVINYIARTIRIIDSLGCKHEDVYRNVKRWLKSENATSQIDWNLEHTFQTWPECVQIQQQADSYMYNCGVFVIGYVKAMLTGRAFESFSRRGACNQMCVGIFNWIVHGGKLV
jgi:Ulp1 family protease